MKKIDIAIIGGGISGLYCAYHLKKAYPTKVIALYEGLPMLGGRIQTGIFADGLFRPAYGALRIEPEYQTEMHAFMNELAIPVKHIEQGEASSSSIPDLDRLSLEEKERIQKYPELGADLVLLELGLQKILGHQWDLESDTLLDPTRECRIAQLKKSAVYKMKPLYQQGVWNVFSDVLSYEAVEFFREKGAYYNMKNDNQNAIDWIVFLLNLRLIKMPSYIPVGGMIEMIHLIEQKISSLGVDIFMNHHLTELAEDKESGVSLTFNCLSSTDSVVQVMAKHVILAMPQYPLKKLARYLPERINTLLDSVLPVPILWATATLKNPSWGNDAKPTSGERAPIRAAHLEYKEHQGQSYGLAMLYCDGPWHQYWRHFVEDAVQDFQGYQIHPQVNKNLLLKDEIENTLQRHFDLKNKPSIEEWGIRDWGRPPFGAGVHFWKTGAESDEIIRALTSFSLGGSSNDQPIHICGEAYSECQGFFEGAIRTAKYVVSDIFQSYR